ncbi:Uncharacterised protein [Legionella londiniensis]|nr:Uncharacterised protein [Legionella londiniensis]
MQALVDELIDMDSARVSDYRPEPLSNSSIA